MKRLSSLLVALALTGLLAAPVVFANPGTVAPAATAKAELVDINSASEVQLKVLPGIGDAYAKKIIAGRPYAKKDQLKSKGIIPAATYDKVQEKIIASQKGK